MTIALIILAAAIAAVLLYAAAKPGIFHISRSADIRAPADSIFPLVNDLADHEKWSPFARDPKVKNIVSTPSTGAGARVDFNGSCAGTLSITDSSSPSRIAMRLLITKPMKADNEVEFIFTARDDPAGVATGVTTSVTWAMSGPQPYLGRLMSVFINCEKMVGRQFEQGLADLKRLSEQQA